MKLSHLLAAVAISTLFVGALPGCGSSDDASVEDNDGDDELKAGNVTLTDADNGKTATLEVGKTLTVKLSGNGTAGYNWSVQVIDRTLGQPTIKFKPASGAVGSGGTTTFTWKTNSPLNMEGKHTVRLDYARSWEKNKPAAKTFDFTVNIVKASAAGQMCGGFANIKCPTGFKCVAHAPPQGAQGDMAGACQAGKE